MSQQSQESEIKQLKSILAEIMLAVSSGDINKTRVKRIVELYNETVVDAVTKHKAIYYYPVAPEKDK